MDTLSERVENLSPAKRALLEQRLRKVKSPARDGIPRRAQNENLPLSFEQELLWLLAHVNPDSTAYNVPRILRLGGTLDVSALQKALDALVARHEVLRTRIVAVNGIPSQVIDPAGAVEIAQADLSGCEASQREPEAMRLLLETARRRFDLARDAMLRVQLVRLAKQDHILLLLTHHIASDGWSRSILYDELAALYESYVTGTPAALPELSIQYADYAAWQRARLQENTLQRELGYWKQQLADAPPVLELPADHPRPPIQSFRGAREYGFMAPALRDALKRLSRRADVTLFMTLLAAFQTLLYRYTNQSDLVVGTPVAGRTRVETEGLIGYFSNTLPLRMNLSGDPSFLQLLERVRQVALAAYAHQELPFEKLVVELQRERDLSYTPIFQILFALQNTPSSQLIFGDLTATPIELDRGTAKFDLVVSLTEKEDGLKASFEYNSDLFGASTIRRMIANFQVLLEDVVAHPERPLSRLEILTARERRQLLVEWNDTARPFATAELLHGPVEAQAARTPDADAVQDGERILSYAELNRRANQLAHLLRARGVGRGARVGILLGRSAELIVGLLGVLKAGGICVPLDPNYPPARLEYIARDAGLALLVTQTELMNHVPRGVTTILALEADWKLFEREREDNPDVGLSPQDAAYLIYTSGSTGEPKGVVLTHEGLVSHQRAVAGPYGIQATDRVLQFASSSFDISIEEIFMTLSKGATLVLSPSVNTMSGREFRDWIEGARISVLDLPTAYWHAWVSGMAAVHAVLPDTLRLVIVGGEKALVQTYNLWLTLAGGARVRWLNTYGPTEGSVVATMYEPASRTEHLLKLPIGRPIANTRAYILDGHGQPVPVGVPGELVIGGPGVARGYWNRPALTAEKFMPDPFGADPGGRLYRTGDFARFLADGAIEFVGRQDEQVKWNGYRIELGEIQAALLANPSVGEALEVLREDEPGVKRLVAYVSCQHGETISPPLLRDFVSSRLPIYMQPSAYVVLDALPRTPNGKVNRRALPIPTESGKVEARGRVAPRTPVERKLAETWRAVLGVAEIGIHDNFFDLGGHSLLAMRLLAELEKRFEQRLPLALLFQAPTIEQFALTLSQGQVEYGWSVLVPIQPQGTRKPFFCVHGFGGGVVGYRELAQSLGPDQPFYGLLAYGQSGEGAPDQRVEVMAARYIEAIRTVQPDGPYLLGGYCFGATVALEMAQQLLKQGQTTAVLAVFDHFAPKTGYRQFKWGRHFVAGFLRNLPYWWEDFRKLEPARRSKRMRRKARAWGKKAFRRTNQERMSAGIDLADLVEDLSRVSAARRGLMELHYAALREYVPKFYPGSVTVFRARRQPLICSYDPQLGWGKLAQEIQVRDVSGAHHNILEMPHVRVLANELRACLDAVQGSVRGA